MSEFDTSRLDDEEFLHRQLCPDGACIGVLDAQGVCKECGMVGSSATTDPRLRGLKNDRPVTPPPDSEALPESAADATAGASDGEAGEEPSAGDLPDEFANRRLCPDGACIGVVGPSGTCGECGQVA